MCSRTPLSLVGARPRGRTNTGVGVSCSPAMSDGTCEAAFACRIMRARHSSANSKVVSGTGPGHYDGACRHRPIAPELFPFQATCALKRKVFPRFWLRDDIARKAAQMIGQVGTGTPLVLVCLALLRSSAGRRRLNKKREKKRSHLAWAATLLGRHKKHAFARRAFVSGGGLRRNAKGRRRVFVPGLAGALQRRRRRRRGGCSLC